LLRLFPQPANVPFGIDNGGDRPDTRDRHLYVGAKKKSLWRDWRKFEALVVLLRL
jgi:hypothetical protein